MSSAGLSAFRHRDFALFWTSLVTEAFALQMAFVAIGWQVYAVRGNPLDLGLVGLAEFLPLPLLALPAGHLADRLPRRRLLMVMLVLNLVVLGGLLAVTAAGATRVWPFFVLAFMQGVGSAIAVQGSAVVGLSIGVILFEIQPVLVYVVAMLLALAALGCVIAMRSGRLPVSGGATAGFGEVLAGVRLIRRTNVLLGAISLDLFAVLLGGAVALLPVFAKDILEVGPTGLGFLRAAPAVGSLLCAAFIARYPIQRQAGPKLFVVVAGFGVCMIVFGLSRTMWLSMLALALGSAFDTVSVVLRSTILPLVTPDALRGRVTAVEMVFISASNELGAFESGVAAALIGAVPAVVVGGILTIVVAGAWWKLFPSLARVDRLDELRPVSVSQS